MYKSLLSAKINRYFFTDVLVGFNFFSNIEKKFDKQQWKKM